MKKLISIIVIITLVSIVAKAEPRAIGIRASYGIEASYQHAFGNSFLEGDLGLFEKDFAVHAMYDFIFASPNWSNGEWNFYAGPGVGMNINNGAHFSICAQIGGDYTFATVPLQLSLDLRPDIVRFGGETTFFKGWYPSLGIRYRF